MGDSYSYGFLDEVAPAVRRGADSQVLINAIELQTLRKELNEKLQIASSESLPIDEPSYTVPTKTKLEQVSFH